MTEKDYRKIITDLELNSNDKENIKNFYEQLENKIKENIRFFEIEKIIPAGAYTYGTLSHHSKEIDLALIIKNTKNNSFPLMNQIVLNELYNFAVINYQINKTSQIKILNQANGIYFETDKYNVTLLIRYIEPLDYQTDYYLSQDELRTAFMNKANTDFPLFKNTVMLLKHYRDINNIKLSGYIISLLLYYGLCENFTTHSYYAYLKEFVHAVDDFLKEIKIEQDDETYRALKIKKEIISKKGYQIIDIANQSTNLALGFGEAALSDIRKFKKIIAKLDEK